MKTIVKISLFILAFTIFSCKKNGTGGKADVELHSVHHDDHLKGGTFYIKFGATELPSNPTSNYDLKLTADSDKDYVVVENLLRGDYYIYSEAYDPAIMAMCKGGLAFKIKWTERKKFLHAHVPVTE